MRTGKTLYFDCVMGAAGDMLLGALFALAPAQDAFSASVCRPGAAGGRAHGPAGHAGRDPRCTDGADSWRRGRVGGAAAWRCAAAPARSSPRSPPSPRPSEPAGCGSDPGGAAGFCLGGGAGPGGLWPHCGGGGRGPWGAGAAGTFPRGRRTGRHRRRRRLLYAAGAAGPGDICASPVSTGRGTVRCAHGELPVPAPATAFLLQGIPTQPGPAAVTGELCTPTGAALLAQFAASFGPRPALAEAACGCGFGTKRFPLPNCVRAWLGYAPR